MIGQLLGKVWGRALRSIERVGLLGLWKKGLGIIVFLEDD